MALSLIDYFCMNEIVIDFGSEIRYGEDQCDVFYPSRFPTVTFRLMDTNGLNKFADRIRQNAGYRPMHLVDEYNVNTWNVLDNEGWYEFFIGINDFSTSHVDSGIEFVVVNSNSLDNEEWYSIDLTEEEQNAVFKCLNDQCRKHLGKSCVELLDDARQRMR